MAFAVDRLLGVIISPQTRTVVYPTRGSGWLDSPTVLQCKLRINTAKPDATLLQDWANSNDEALKALAASPNPPYVFRWPYVETMLRNMGQNLRTAWNCERRLTGGSNVFVGLAIPNLFQDGGGALTDSAKIEINLRNLLWYPWNCHSVSQAGLDGVFMVQSYDPDQGSGFAGVDFDWANSGNDQVGNNDYVLNWKFRLDRLAEAVTGTEAGWDTWASPGGVLNSTKENINAGAVFAGFRHWGVGASSTFSRLRGIPSHLLYQTFSNLNVSQDWSGFADSTTPEGKAFKNCGIMLELAVNLRVDAELKQFGMASHIKTVLAAKQDKAYKDLFRSSGETQSGFYVANLGSSSEVLRMILDPLDPGLRNNIDKYVAFILDLRTGMDLPLDFTKLNNTYGDLVTCEIQLKLWIAGGVFVFDTNKLELDLRLVGNNTQLRNIGTNPLGIIDWTEYASEAGSYCQLEAYKNFCTECGRTQNQVGEERMVPKLGSCATLSSSKFQDTRTNLKLRISRFNAAHDAMNTALSGVVNTLKSAISFLLNSDTIKFPAGSADRAAMVTFQQKFNQLGTKISNLQTVVTSANAFALNTPAGLNCAGSDVEDQVEEQLTKMEAAYQAILALFTQFKTYMATQSTVIDLGPVESFDLQALLDLAQSRIDKLTEDYRRQVDTGCALGVCPPVNAPPAGPPPLDIPLDPPAAAASSNTTTYIIIGAAVAAIFVGYLLYSRKKA